MEKIIKTFFTPVAALLFITSSVMLVTPSVAKEYGDVVMDSKKESMADAEVKSVVFPHWFHRIRYKCKVCHERIFIMEKGANDVTMDSIMQGEYCGVCHNGKIAWEAFYCDKCHTGDSEPQSAGR